MKVALLGNGSSRVLYSPTDRYDYTIGCNIPWTKVDSTVIMDVNVLEKWENLCNFYVSRNAWRGCRKRDRYNEFLIEIVDTVPEYDSSGHMACRILLKLGATEIDIYGCDSWFTNDTESYTHKYVDSRSDNMTKNVSAWRANWYKMMSENLSVKFNFIGNLQ